MSDTYTNLNDASTEEMSTLAEPKVALRDYVLPPATSTTLGGVIVGDGLSVDGNGRLDATGLRKTATKTFDYIPENSNQTVLLMYDFDFKITGKEIVKIELVDGNGNLHDADKLCGKDTSTPCIRINKYVEFDETANADILGYYAAFGASRAAWFMNSFYQVIVTYYI